MVLKKMREFTFTREQSFIFVLPDHEHGFRDGHGTVSVTRTTEALARGIAFHPARRYVNSPKPALTERLLTAFGSVSFHWQCQSDSNRTATAYSANACSNGDTAVVHCR